MRKRNMKWIVLTGTLLVTPAHAANSFNANHCPTAYVVEEQMDMYQRLIERVPMHGNARDEANLKYYYQELERLNKEFMARLDRCENR